MKALVIFAHPNPQSYNAAILDAVKAELGQQTAEVRVKDLYRMNWNPNLGLSDLQQIYSGGMPEDIAREQADIRWADALILIGPIWWWTLPAIVKGYIDRVFSYGFAYEFTEKGLRGLMAGKRAIVITTSGADEKGAAATGMIDAIKTGFINAVFGSCGFTPIAYKNCFGVVETSDEVRRHYLEEVKEFVRNNLA
ncbi:MAG: NAD(P)H-dependent oxidoreductase [Firmicutes bacterium]|nr:NAD(P)H-dependent oxidoreductase [Bacillota bacterium]